MARRSVRVGLLALLPMLSLAQSIDQIVERLNRLEQENQALKKEVQELRGEVDRLRGPASAPAPPTVAERLDIAERRIDEQAQTKVESSQKLPIKFHGMALANIYRNGRQANNVDHATTAARIPGRSTAGMTFRQSQIGIAYTGAGTFLGGTVGGSIMGDFFEGPTENNNFAPARLRTASVHIDWESRSIMVGQEKPLISPRDPSSFSFQGVSPLTAAGNLWRWQPQVRLEQRVAFNSRTTLRGQGALYQTSEEATSATTLPFERRRPGIEGRFEIAHEFDDRRRVEVAHGFHVSESRINGIQLPSRVHTVDWFANPFEKIEFSGTFWTGQNLHHFGALRQGVVVRAPNRIDVVHSKGGWAQIAIPFTPRLTMNTFMGIHADRARDLLLNSIGNNQTSAINVMYRIAPNTIVTLEGMRIRTFYVGSGPRKNNRYDLSVAYLF